MIIYPRDEYKYNKLNLLMPYIVRYFVLLALHRVVEI